MQEDPNFYSRVLYRLSYIPLPAWKQIHINYCFKLSVGHLENQDNILSILIIAY